MKELRHFPATLSGLSSIGCWDELRAGYGADGVGASVVPFTVPIAGAYSENLPVIGLLDFVLLTSVLPNCNLLSGKAKNTIKEINNYVLQIIVFWIIL